jgi:8-amino-7-oxononanoate synthase
VRPLAEELAGRLRELAAAGLARAPALPRGRDFCSNDYLGLAADRELRAALAARLAALPPEARLLAPASRLLRGHTELHEHVERRLAELKGTEAALLFASGYQANVGLLTALAGRGDLALSDALNHASLIDGLRLAGCRRTIYPHLDLETVERELAAAAAARADGAAGPARTFVVTESLFSMDGDIAPLDRLAELCERHGADLIVDDAHATGLFGAARGSGLCEHYAVERRAAAIVSTLGKACGVAGGFVAGSRALVDYLASRCRPFVFSTAVPPLLLHAVDLALDRMAAEPARRRRTLALADRLRGRLAAHGLPCGAGPGPIVPVLLGGNRRALAAAERLAERGFDVRAVRPPTVPPGTARLRISIHADHAEDEIDALAAAVAWAALSLLVGSSEGDAAELGMEGAAAPAEQDAPVLADQDAAEEDAAEPAEEDAAEPAKEDVADPVEEDVAAPAPAALPVAGVAAGVERAR